jgi:hypothetical protein
MLIGLKNGKVDKKSKKWRYAGSLMYQGIAKSSDVDLKVLICTLKTTSELFCSPTHTCVSEDRHFFD